MSRTDVLIVGAGPTGLVLALWLNAQGVTFRIVDKSVGPSEESRATAVQARTLELYRQIGIGDAVADEGHKCAGVVIWTEGKRRARMPIGETGVDITPYPFLLVYPQNSHERFLIEQLRSKGIEVERQVGLLEFVENGDVVEARLRTADGDEETHHASYIAGCDGARSTVRKVLGADFEGGTYSKTFYVADIEAASDPFEGETHLAFEGPEFLLAMPYGVQPKMRLIGSIREDRVDEDKMLGFGDVGHRAIESLGIEVKTVDWFATYRVHHRLADRFRHGRVFLLGDAAHVHSPVGGQGMNTGIGDAINLAWKLAAVVKGHADDELLDSFDLERPVFARKLVETTDRVFSFLMQKGDVVQFLRNRVAPIVANIAMSLQPARELMFRVASQTTLGYRDSPLSSGKAGTVSGGERLPFVRVDGGDNYGPLVAIGWQAHVYGTVKPDLKDWCQQRRLPLHVFEWHAHCGDAGLERDAVYLLRPDTYVALAASEATPAVLSQYFAERRITEFV